MHFNPLAEVVIAYRKMLLFAEMPSWQGLIFLYGMALITFVAGGLLFRYVKRSFAECPLRSGLRLPEAGRLHRRYARISHHGVALLRRVQEVRVVFGRAPALPGGS